MAFKGWKVGLFPAEMGHGCEQAQEPTHTAPRTRIAIKGVQTSSLDNVQHMYCKTLHVLCRNFSHGRWVCFTAPVYALARQDSGSTSFGSCPPKAQFLPASRLATPATFKEQLNLRSERRCNPSRLG